MDYKEKAKLRAQAIKRYRFLCKLEHKARERRLYSAAIEYRNEATFIKEYYVL